MSSLSVMVRLLNMLKRRVEVWEVRTCGGSVFGVRNGIWAEYTDDLVEKRFKTRKAAEKWIEKKGYQLVRDGYCVYKNRLSRIKDE